MHTKYFYISIIVFICTYILNGLVLATHVYYTRDVLGNADLYSIIAVISVIATIIGISIAQMPLKAIFCNGKLYIFSVIKLLVVPIVCVILLNRFAQTQMLFSIFILMLAMPTGSIVVMIAREYGGKIDREDICSKGILLTTLMSMLTIQIVILFL